MRILAIETATEACSVALFDNGELIGSQHELIGRGHAERLVPMIAELPHKGRADAVRVSLGPGSFTGVRIGLAAARALGIAWDADVRGYPTLALVTAMARVGEGHPVTICMTGGHGEWFVQKFGADGLPCSDLASLTPDEAARIERNGLVAGTKAEDLAQRCSRLEVSPVRLPDARHTLELPNALLTDALAPLYGRPPDARLPTG